jgi:hypothetical protein
VLSCCWGSSHRWPSFPLADVCASRIWRLNAGGGGHAKPPLSCPKCTLDAEPFAIPPLSSVRAPDRIRQHRSAGDGGASWGAAKLCRGQREISQSLLLLKGDDAPFRDALKNALDHLLTWRWRARGRVRRGRGVMARRAIAFAGRARAVAVPG